MTTEELFITGAIFAVLWLWLIWQDRRMDRLENKLDTLWQDDRLKLQQQQQKLIDREYEDINWGDF